MCPICTGILGYPAESSTNSLSLAADPLDAENTPPGVVAAVSTEVQVLKVIRTGPRMDMVYIAGQFPSIVCPILSCPSPSRPTKLMQVQRVLLVLGTKHGDTILLLRKFGHSGQYVGTYVDRALNGRPASPPSSKSLLVI
jgi:hypothetical protein